MENLKSQLDFIKEVEIKEVIDEAKAKAAAEINEARARIEQIKNKETTEILKKAQETEQRELDATKIDGKRKVMNLKFQLIESALSSTLTGLKEMVEKEAPSYRNHLEEFIIEAAKRIDGWEFELIIGSKDAAFVKKRLKRIEDALSTVKGVVVSLKVSDEPLRSIGGIVVRSSDQREIFNNTLEARLARVRQENLPEISQVLFGGEEQ
ncbi:MAG TPA: V-type ATP synthase subunit E family protein [Patescibacteria group bacterium]|nr:V-type ATP synthase subunit E family protein [Patescibacteria group bacterium]